MPERAGGAFGWDFPLACYYTLGKSSIESVVFGYMGGFARVEVRWWTMLLLVCFFFWIFGCMPFFFFFQDSASVVLEIPGARLLSIPPSFGDRSQPPFIVSFDT